MNAKVRVSPLFLISALFLAITAVLSLPGVSLAASFEKTFGGEKMDYGLSAQQTKDGGYIMAGWTMSSGEGSKDFYLVKVGEKGELQWESVLGGLLSEDGSSVEQTSDGGYIVAGTSQSFGRGPSDIYIVKTDETGNRRWWSSLGGWGDEIGYSIQQTSDGGYIVTGMTKPVDGGSWDAYLAKTDSSGKLQWEKTFGGPGNDSGNSVKQTSDGGYVVAGKKAGERDEVYMIKTSKTGKLQWEKTFGGAGHQRGNAVIETADGAYLVAGVTYSKGSSDVYLVKTDAKGVLQWEKTFGGVYSDEGFDVKESSDGGYVVAGWTDSIGAGNADVYLLKTDASGNLQWEKAFGGKKDDMGNSVWLTEDGGFVVSGYSASYGTDLYDAYLIKTDKSGN